MKKAKKDFDCIAEKERIQSEIAKDIEGMTLEEERAYYNKKSGNKKFEAWVEKVRQHSANRGKTKKSG